MGLLERFESKFEKVDGCWEWMGYRNRTGYGGIGVPLSGRNSYFVQRYAHRVSWELYRGPIPDKICVCHRCDNPSCVNPDHLFLGSRKDNTQDMVKKGRHIEGARKRGEARKGIPWTPSQRKAIMVSLPRSDRHFRAIEVTVDGVTYPTITEAARAFGVSRQTMWHRINKQTPKGAWKV